MNRVWTAVERVLGFLALLAMASLVALPVGQVVLREVFSRPIVGIEEFTRWGLICTVFLGVPLLIRTGEQIRLTEFVDWLPRLARQALERLTLLAGGIAFAITAWVGFRSAFANIGTRTPTIDIPFWLFAAPMFVGLGLAGLGYIWVALRREDPPSSNGNPIL